jgi:hypothetical protein
MKEKIEKRINKQQCFEEQYCEREGKYMTMSQEIVNDEDKRRKCKE